jgi:hypothetical protein
MPSAATWIITHLDFRSKHWPARASALTGRNATISSHFRYSPPESLSPASRALLMRQSIGIHVILRILYTIAYITDRSTLRSVLFILGALCVLGLFAAAGFA